MCNYDRIVIEGEAGTVYCPQRSCYVVEPINLRILLQNIFNRSQLPANPNRARILFGDQDFSLLDTILNTNQNINYPQTRFVNAPNVSLDHNPAGRGGYFELPHRRHAGNQRMETNSRIEGQPVQQDFSGGDEDIGPADLVRDTSHTSSNMYSSYATSNNPSYAPSQHDSLDNLSGHLSPETPTLNSPSQSGPLIQYTAQRPPTGYENELPYGGSLSNDHAVGYSILSSFAHGTQYPNMNSGSRLDQNLATSIAARPLTMDGSIAGGSRIPEASEPTLMQRHIYLLENGHQPGFDTQVADAFDHYIPDGSDADTGYAAQPDLTGLTSPNQVADVAYSAAIDDDQLTPHHAIEQEQPHPPRQTLAKPGGADSLTAPRHRQPESNASTRGICKRGKKARKVAEFLTKIKEKFATKESKEQYTKNRRIRNCLLCKRGGCKRACNYFGDDRVCDVCEKAYGKQPAAELCFQYHLSEVLFCDFELWRPSHEPIGDPLPPWPRNLAYLSMYFAIGPIESSRVSRVAVDSQATVFDNSQLASFINQLGISLVVNHRLIDQEATFVDEARYCVGFYFLIERYRDMIYHAKPEELELGRHLIHCFLHTLVHEFSARAKTLIERSHEWLMEPKHTRKRSNAVVIVLAVLYGLCARQSNLTHKGYLETTMSYLREQAERALPHLLKFGTVAYWLMASDFKNRAPPGGFQSFTQVVLERLATHLNTEIHVTHEFIPPNQALPSSLDWINGSNAMNAPFERLLDYRGNFKDLDKLLQFILSEPLMDETALPSSVPRSIYAFLSSTDDPPFLVEKEPSPIMQDPREYITHASPHVAQIDDNGDGDEDETTPRLSDNKGKGRADSNADADIGESEIAELLRLQEADELEAVLQASRTTEASLWDSSFGGPSRLSGSSGKSSQRYYPY